jgi:hypothetical protein
MDIDTSATEQTAASIERAVPHPHAQSLLGTFYTLREDGLEKEDQGLHDGFVLHELANGSRSDIKKKKMGQPFSTISPTNTFPKPATIWATGCETCCPRVCWMT